MAIVELILPELKPDQASLEELVRDWPQFMAKLTNPNPGILHAFHGWVLTEDGRNVRDENKKVILFEWDKMESFTTFIKTSRVTDFAKSVGHLFTGPPRPQVFQTNISTKNAARALSLDIFRLQVQGLEAAASAIRIWDGIYSYLKKQHGEDVIVSYGRSQNLEDELVVGFIAWQRPESAGSQDAKLDAMWTELRSTGELSRINVSLEEMSIPPVGSTAVEP
ncbi:Uncharacterized protein PECH_000821 [Penicillium ucsense]|uniref:ABM domain-containing protein n=1 Tax=Penicillium ucsense TaxID=2839758 RepID=A0A8J8VZU6_9EURO|nr:Uncharacterized protein PECM_000506 [Penicillium ucsense]KAF7733319.1 Uncharacterized protein PECH_000821 [Penicillium ucsense]